jgi:hypothetical protein
MGDDDEDREVVEAMRVIASDLEEAGFSEAVAATLREDWADARADAEQRIRTWVERAAADDATVLVIPMRLSGFGPYAEVLSGLDYVAAESLLPHTEIGAWIRATALQVACENGWTELPGHCAIPAVDGGASRR